MRPGTLALALLTACSKPPAGDSPAPAPSASAAPTLTQIEAVPSAGASAVVSPSAAPVATTPSVHAAASHTAPLASATPAPAVVGSTAPSASAAPAVPVSVQYASNAASGNHYNVAVSARTECAVGSECNGTITLTASGGYHINDEYPYRFVVDDSPGVEWVAADGKGFGKTTGDFKKTTATTADIGIRYRGKQAGGARLSGTYKMSVCSEANCQVETVPVTVNVTFR